MNIDIIQVRMPEDTLLHLAVERGNMEAVKLLVDLGIDINAKGDMHETALHAAVRTEHFDIYDYLVSQGADENIRSQFNRTPAEYKQEVLSSQ